MLFPTAPAPHKIPPPRTARIMRQVLLALLPGIVLTVWQFGPGVLIQLALALVVALSVEAAVLALRHRPLTPLLDGSAALTAALLALALPPLLPWWATAFGAAFAIVFGKQLYGGLGFNPFNPAMVGYAALLLAFPKLMSAWLPPLELATPPDFEFALAAILNPSPAADGLAQATPLDTLKTQLGIATHLDEIQSARIFGGLSGRGWQWLNFGYLLGGLWLLRRRLIDWRIPASFLASLSGLSLVFFLAAPALYPTPLFHLFSGATMLGAFFIATDPVSAATTPRGRLIYGGLIGVLVFVIRSGGSYPDGLAFAVLLLNFAAPTLDHYSRPRVYGHPR